MAPLSANYIARALQSNRDFTRIFLNSFDDDCAIAILKTPMSRKTELKRLRVSSQAEFSIFLFHENDFSLPP